MASCSGSQDESPPLRDRIHENRGAARTHSDIYKRKYVTLKRKCESIQLDNEKCLNRLYYVKKAVRKMSREKRFLMTKLNKYGDDFKNATLPLPIEDDSMLHLMSINNPIAPSFPASRGLAGLVSKSQRKSTVGRPRAGRPRLISEMTSRNDNLRQPSGRGGKRKRMATQGKLEKDKDPLAPKKPANAFMMFCQTMRQEEMSTKEQDGAGSDLSHQELTRQLAQKWNFLGAGEKETYYSMYERDKDRYHREMKEYIKSNNPEPLPTTKPTPQPPTDSVAKTEPVSSDQPNPTKAPCPVKSEPKPETKQQPPSTSASSTLNAPSTCSVTKPEISIPVKREPKTDGSTLESRTPKLKSSLHPKSPVEGDDPYHFDDD